MWSCDEPETWRGGGELVYSAVRLCSTNYAITHNSKHCRVVTPSRSSNLTTTTVPLTALNTGVQDVKIRGKVRNGNIFDDEIKCYYYSVSPLIRIYKPLLFMKVDPYNPEIQIIGVPINYVLLELFAGR